MATVARLCAAGLLRPAVGLSEKDARASFSGSSGGSVSSDGAGAVVEGAGVMDVSTTSINFKSARKRFGLVPGAAKTASKDAGSHEDRLYHCLYGYKPLLCEVIDFIASAGGVDSEDVRKAVAPCPTGSYLHVLVHSIEHTHTHSCRHRKL